MIYLPIGIKGQHVKINAMRLYIIITVLFLILFMDTGQTLHEASKKRSRYEETQHSNTSSEEGESQRLVPRLFACCAPRVCARNVLNEKKNCNRSMKPKRKRDIPENNEDEQTNIQDRRQIPKRRRTQKTVKGILKYNNNDLVDFISDTIKNGVKMLPKLGQKNDSLFAKYNEENKKASAADAERFKRESKIRKELNEEKLRQTQNDIQNYRKQEEKLFSILIWLREKLGSEKKGNLFSILKNVCQKNPQSPDLILSKAYMWYSAFFLAVNLKICSLAYSSLENVNLLMPEDHKIKKSCDIHFTFINFALRKFRADIKNCVPDSDIGNELEKLDLDFIMNENEMKENNEYDYHNGLIMWNKVQPYSINERYRRTLFPNHYVALGIGYFNELDLYRMFYEKISEVINWEIYEKILQYFSKKMIGKPLSFEEIEQFFNPLNIRSVNFWSTWVNHDELKLGKSVHDNIIKTIQLINIFREINTKKTLDFLQLNFI